MLFYRRVPSSERPSRGGSEVFSDGSWAESHPPQVVAQAIPGFALMSLRILHVADVAPDPNSGAAGTCFQEILALRRAGHEVDEIWADQLSRRIRHYNLRYLLELPWSLRYVVRRKLTQAKYDIVQVSQPHGYLVARDIMVSQNPAVFVHRSHGFEGRLWRDLLAWNSVYPTARRASSVLASAGMAKLLEINNRLTARFASGHIVGASECAEYIVDKYGVDSQRVRVIPQGISDSFRRPTVALDWERLKRVLYVGQYAYFKAPMILIGSVTEILLRHAEVCFTWVCSRVHHAEIISQFPESVRNRVSLLDSMNQDDLVNVYDSHGVFLFPSFFEGFGKVFLEAMSRGLVVVAADNSGVRDVIVNGYNGIKTRTGDVAGMVSHADHVFRNIEYARKISNAGIRCAHGLTWDRHAEMAGDFYETLIRFGSKRS